MVQGGHRPGPSKQVIPGPFKMSCMSQSKIMAISPNPQTNMLGLIAQQLGYPEVLLGVESCSHHHMERWWRLSGGAWSCGKWATTWIEMQNKTKLNTLSKKTTKQCQTASEPPEPLPHCVHPCPFTLVPTSRPFGRHMASVLI